MISSLVPMIYRLGSTIIAAWFAGLPLPMYTWGGVAIVFVGSVTFMSRSGVDKGKV